MAAPTTVVFDNGFILKAGSVASLAGVGGAGRPIEVVQIEDAAAASTSRSIGGH